MENMLLATCALGEVLSDLPWFAWIAIVAIVMGGISSIVKMSHRHRERIEMIRHGIDPRNRRDV